MFNIKNRFTGIFFINILSALSQIVQIGTIPPLLSLNLTERGFSSANIGFVISSSWIAILILYKFIPYVLNRLGMLTSIILSSLLSITAILGMIWSNSLISFIIFNLILGVGLIIRWIACDTWLIVTADDKTRGRSIGIHETLMGLGIAIGPLLITLFGYSGKASFYACIIIMLFSTLCLLFLSNFNVYPEVPNSNNERKVFPLIYIALLSAFFGGFIETSSISFLSLIYLSLGYLSAVATMLLSVFGFGGTFMQMVFGYIADKKSVFYAQLLVSIILIFSIILMLLKLPLLLNGIVVFIFGGCVGGLNTLAVLDASEKVKTNQISTAMMLVAIAYTSGSIIGPICTGLVVSYFDDNGLLFLSAIATLLFIIFLLINRFRTKI